MSRCFFRLFLLIFLAMPAFQLPTFASSEIVNANTSQEGVVQKIWYDPQFRIDYIEYFEAGNSAAFKTEVYKWDIPTQWDNLAQYVIMTYNGQGNFWAPWMNSPIPDNLVHTEKLIPNFENKRVVAVSEYSKDNYGTFEASRVYTYTDIASDKKVMETLSQWKRVGEKVVPSYDSEKRWDANGKLVLLQENTYTYYEDGAYLIISKKNGIKVGATRYDSQNQVTRQYSYTKSGKISRIDFYDPITGKQTKKALFNQKQPYPKRVVYYDAQGRIDYVEYYRHEDSKEPAKTFDRQYKEGGKPEEYAVVEYDGKLGNFVASWQNLQGIIAHHLNPPPSNILSIKSTDSATVYDFHFKKDQLGNTTAYLNSKVYAAKDNAISYAVEFTRVYNSEGSFLSETTHSQKYYEDFLERTTSFAAIDGYKFLTSVNGKIVEKEVKGAFYRAVYENGKPASFSYEESAEGRYYEEEWYTYFDNGQLSWVLKTQYIFDSSNPEVIVGHIHTSRGYEIVNGQHRLARESHYILSDNGYNITDTDTDSKKYTYKANGKLDTMERYFATEPDYQKALWVRYHYNDEGNVIKTEHMNKGTGEWEEDSLAQNQKVLTEVNEKQAVIVQAHSSVEENLSLVGQMAEPVNSRASFE